MPSSQPTNKKIANYDRYAKSSQKKRRLGGAYGSQNHTRGMNNLYQRCRGAFLRYYYKYNHFGHKITKCRLNIRIANFQHQNIFAPLKDNMMECYKYHNIGHIAKFYRSQFKNSHQLV